MSYIFAAGIVVFIRGLSILVKVNSCNNLNTNLTQTVSHSSSATKSMA